MNMKRYSVSAFSEWVLWNFSKKATCCEMTGNQKRPIWGPFGLRVCTHVYPFPFTIIFIFLPIFSFSYVLKHVNCIIIHFNHWLWKSLLIACDSWMTKSLLYWESLKLKPDAVRTSPFRKHHPERAGTPWNIFLVILVSQNQKAGKSFL